GTVGTDGRMALVDHFRELRARVLRSLVVLILCIVIAFFFYTEIRYVVTLPYHKAMEMLGQKTDSELIVSGVGGPLLLQLKLCGLAGLLLSSPWWLAETWGFVLPALHENERKWSYVFAAIAGPLFLFGVTVGYLTMPKALQVLIGFTPDYVKSLVDFNEYFSFLTRTLIVFGVSFEIPIFIVLLSLAGIIKGSQLRQYRSWILVAVFVFAAVATPSTDPFSMLFLAVPMAVLMLISEIIARLIDKRRGRSRDLDPTWGDDEQSPL
ncbi:MAG TPA: twin-arginine translocase subunit TatC, partial [Marmoricola sp.]|nr:twin-arginine translocase subunit TatC [Marmoricola sp.]